MGLLDLFKTAKATVEASPPEKTSWARYREILEAECRGESSAADAGELLGLANELGFGTKCEDENYSPDKRARLTAESVEARIREDLNLVREVLAAREEWEKLGNVEADLAAAVDRVQAIRDAIAKKTATLRKDLVKAQEQVTDLEARQQRRDYLQVAIRGNQLTRPKFYEGDVVAAPPQCRHPEHDMSGWPAVGFRS